MPINFKNSVILAPLTKGGNLPFRRLCCHFGAAITVSEMAYARFVVKGEVREKALLRRHADEKIFGVQLAAKDPIEATEAAKIAIDMGADFIDINCGCPIEDTTRRGLGASLLKKTRTIESLVSGMVSKISVPVTVKIRLGWKEDEKNFIESALAAERAGASAITVHGRTREQRYSRAADWQAIAEVKAAVKIPVIGNGDILTHYEAEARLEQSHVDGIMLGRGALIKPWLFQEINESKTLQFSPKERVEILFLFTKFLKEHFRDDEKGIRRIMQFLPWHFAFFHRYQYLPKDRYLDESKLHPLMQSRTINESSLDPIDRLLASPNPDIHIKIAQMLLQANEDTLVALSQQLAEELIESDAFKTQLQDRNQFDAVANG
jgi:tRNA-dihydrouridine synthase 3